MLLAARRGEAKKFLEWHVTMRHRKEAMKPIEGEAAISAKAI